MAMKPIQGVPGEMATLGEGEEMEQMGGRVDNRTNGGDDEGEGGGGEGGGGG